MARVTFNRPAVRNAIDPGLIEGLADAVDRAEAGRAHVLLLTGAGVDFCAGADLEHVRHVSEDTEALGDFVASLAEVLDRLEQASFVTVAALHGNVMAGGCEIMLACDVAIAAADTRIGDRHLEYGLLPGAGGSVRLIRSLPRARSRYLLLTGKTLTAMEAAEWGLVTKAVPNADLDEEVESLVRHLASRSGDAIRGAKQMATAARGLSHDEAIVAERRIFLEHFRDSADPHEGLKAFTAKRRPLFRN